MNLNTMDPKKPSPSSKPSSHKHIECTAINLYTIISFIFLLTLQSLTIRNNNTITSTFSHTLTFHPLRDPTTPPYKHPNKTWFMSTLLGKASNGMPEHFVFPSQHPNNKILCISHGNKSYAFASTFPENTTLLPGLTFIADSFYDYENPWHGLNAVAGFFAWMRDNECKKPRRFLLFKNGEVVKRVGNWVYNIMKAGLLGGEVELESLEGRGDGEVVCFERAVVMRRGLGGMSGKMRNGLFEMLRCKAWRYCNANRSRSSRGLISISLVGREGKKRGFKNESAVKDVIKRECEKVDGCSFRLIHFSGNMGFCDQVKIMRNTDILTTTHGAQLTNMMFMSRGSSVMEMFPTGWLEAAGVGQFIYKWFASWSEMRYEGAWRDNNGFNCSGVVLKNDRTACFASLQKDQQVGVNETYLASWITKVLDHHINTNKLVEYELVSQKSSMACSCDQ